MGRVIGALLVGEVATELAETFENSILNRINIEALNLDIILNPDFDLEDYILVLHVACSKSVAKMTTSSGTATYLRPSMNNGQN